MQQNKKTKIVLFDTNVWVSAFINPSGFPAKAINLWLNKKIEVVISLLLLKEIVEVLQRPRLQNKYNYKSLEIQKYVTIITTGANIVEVIGSINLCRDYKDNHILEAAINGKCEYLVTRDDDIKRDTALISQLNKFHVEVVTISNFLKLFDFITY